jgi:hypothetical protein
MEMCLEYYQILLAAEKKEENFLPLLLSHQNQRYLGYIVLRDRLQRK